MCIRDSYGTMYGFKFFPPNTPITQEDRDNFEYYKMCIRDRA